MEVVYSRAAEISRTLKVQYEVQAVPFGTWVLDPENWVWFCGAATCPCGRVEVVGTMTRKDGLEYVRKDHERKIRLHHAWHMACFEAGIDPETKLDLSKLCLVAEQLELAIQRSYEPNKIMYDQRMR